MLHTIQYLAHIQRVADKPAHTKKWLRFLTLIVDKFKTVWVRVTICVMRASRIWLVETPNCKRYNVWMEEEDLLPPKRDLKAACIILQFFLFKIACSVDGGAHSTENIYTQNTVHLLEEIPHRETLLDYLFQSCQFFSPSIRHLPRCWYEKQRELHLQSLSMSQDRMRTKISLDFPESVRKNQGCDLHLLKNIGKLIVQKSPAS